MDGAHLTLPSCTAPPTTLGKEMSRGGVLQSLSLCPAEEADKKMGVDLPVEGLGI